MPENFLFLILVGALVGAAAGYLGSFMVIKRMALVGDALSHVALPGMAIALALHFSPMLGAFIALTLAVFGIWYLQERSEIYPEALVGIFFTASLALGVLLTPEPELLEALFGNLEKVSRLEGILAILISALVVGVTWLISQKLVLSVISEDLAKAGSVSVAKVEAIYLFLVGVVVALGVKFIGTLLMGALVIIPAATAKNVSQSLGNYLRLATVLGLVSAVVGVSLAGLLGLPCGPIVVLVGILMFGVSYFFKKD
jgi:ABC-type Mn2+/Zn2+ transport system permease subunit